jgi:hypothetical protein
MIQTLRDNCPDATRIRAQELAEINLQAPEVARRDNAHPLHSTFEGVDRA